jgi:hypothetical protein
MEGWLECCIHDARGKIETSTAKLEVAAIADDILVASWQSITASSMKKVKP